MKYLLIGIGLSLGLGLSSVSADVWDRLHQIDQETSHEESSRNSLNSRPGPPFTPSTAGQPFGLGKKSPC